MPVGVSALFEMLVAREAHEPQELPVDRTLDLEFLSLRSRYRSAGGYQASKVWTARVTPRHFTRVVSKVWGKI